MARKGENIYKRKDGRWEGRYISSYGINGKAKYGYVYARTYSEVKKKLSFARLNVSLLGFNERKRIISFKALSLEWIQQRKPFLKQSTFIRYRNALENHIIPKLGEYPIDAIDTSLINQFIQQELTNGRLDGCGGLSPKTVTDMLAIIKEVFKYAQNYGTQTRCNFDHISVRKSQHEMRVLSRNEENRLISVLKKEMDLYKLGVYVCLFTGIRVGELCALQWKNVSFSEKSLRVEQTMQRLQNKDEFSVIKTRVVITEPKSFSAIRVIPLPDFLLEILRPFAGNANSFVLSGECKDFVEPRTMQNRFKKYLKEGQITDANFHSLRHTFATRCVEIGFDVKTLSEILGHSSVKITLDRYVHSSLEQKMLNMEKLSCMV